MFRLARQKALIAVAGLCAVASTLAPGPAGAVAERCSKHELRRLVRAFIPAYNSGRFERLDGIFAAEPDFLGYYAAPERTHEAGEDRSTLVDYFRDRHELRDRLELRVFWIQKERERDGSFDFYFELRRTSDENAARGYYVGKGNAGGTVRSCALRLWNMTPPVLWNPPKECDRRAARNVFLDFVRAYNQGATAVLDQIWAREPAFRWYSVGGTAERLDHENRGTLIAYFHQRHEQDDRFRDVELKVSRTRGWHGGWDLVYRLRRTSDDPIFIRSGDFEGKGAISRRCRLFVWSMGRV